MRKRITLLVMLSLVLVIIMGTLTSCSTSDKIPIPKVIEDVYIYDENNIIDDDTEKQLNNMLVELEKKTGAEFSVITIDGLLDRSIETYANNLFNTLGIGKKDKDNGVLLLISKTDTKVRLEIGRGLEGCLNDSKCGRILDNYFVPYREKGEYTKATDQTVKAVLNVLAQEYKIEITGLDKLAADGNETKDGLPWYVWLIIILAIIIILIIIEKFTDDGSGGIVTGIVLSGDSSGGFGGGSSGGGGASR